LESRLVEELWDETPDAILAIAPDDRVMYWNRAAESIFGYSRAEAVGQLLTDLILPMERVDEEQRIRFEVISRDLVIHESVRRRKDGSLVHVSISSKALKDQKTSCATCCPR
jgi:PAS domain S-box-containing protein